MDCRVLRRVSREFNRRRVPECIAKTLLNKSRTLIIEFRGTKASFACCFDENFIDYKYYLLDFADVNFEIEKINQTEKGQFIVVYKRRRA